MKYKKYKSISGLNQHKLKHDGVENKLRFENAFLQSRLAELERQYFELEEQVIRDPLTGVYNRRQVESMLMQDRVQANRKTESVSVVMLDLDNLKKINDMLGHTAGDLALRTLGEKLKQMTRPEDVICRYGGDEFIVFLRNVNLQTAHKRAEEWRQYVEKEPVAFRDIQICLTITAGVANYTEHGNTLSQVIEAADKALYRAKVMGRNFVAAADSVCSLPYDYLMSNQC